MNIKPGVKTSEFYVTLFGMVLTALAAKGIIATSDVSPLLSAIVSVYSGAVAMLTIWGIVSKYIQGRTALKTTSINANQNLTIDNSVKTE